MSGTRDDDAWEGPRREMVEQVARHFSETRESTGLDGMGELLEAVMAKVPRHRFVPASLADLAYADSALSIGFGQTISQPFIVALMIELAQVGRKTRVLEVGTGSGYEAAVLSLMAEDVYSIELVPELAERSATCLAEIGFESIHLRQGDGFEGWEEAAPFDAILVTACSNELPAPLVRQLAIGGRMVIPIGSVNSYQELRVIEKTAADEVIIRHGLPVAFVPLVHSENASAGNDP